MARDLSEEELQLKKRARRRLVGAIVLVAVVAVVLPMVLDSEPRPVTQNVEIQIPSPNDTAPVAPKASAAPAHATAPSGSPGEPVQSARPAENAPAQADRKAEPVLVPSAAATVPATAAPEAPAKSVEPPPAQPKADAQVHKSNAAADPAKAPKAESKAVAKKADTATATPKKEPAPTEAKSPSAKDAGAQSFVVQIAALADSAKAKQMQQQVAAAGVKSYTEMLHTAKGPVTRVRAGPFPTREAAEKAREKLKSAGLEGKVVPR